MRNLSQCITIVGAVALLAGSAPAEPKGCPNCPERPAAGEKKTAWIPPGERQWGPAGERGGRGPGGEAGVPGRFIEKMLEPEMAQKLGLEPEQIKALKKGLARVKRQEEGLQQKLQEAGKAQAELLMAEGDVDEEAVMKAIEQTGRIRTQMAKLRVQPLLLVKKTLTEEQITQVHKMMRERMRERGGDWRQYRKGANQGAEEEMEEAAPAKNRERRAARRERHQDQDEIED